MERKAALCLICYIVNMMQCFIINQWYKLANSLRPIWKLLCWLGMLQLCHECWSEKIKCIILILKPSQKVHVSCSMEQHNSIRDLHDHIITAVNLFKWTSIRQLKGLCVLRVSCHFTLWMFLSTDHFSNWEQIFVTEPLKAFHDKPSHVE